jgi:hypothetical protein
MAARRKRRSARPKMMRGILGSYRKGRRYTYSDKKGIRAGIHNHRVAKRITKYNSRIVKYKTQAIKRRKQNRMLDTQTIRRAGHTSRTHSIGWDGIVRKKSVNTRMAKSNAFYRSGAVDHPYSYYKKVGWKA